MPTNQGETLHDRYAREHRAEMEIVGRMTPDELYGLIQSLHNAEAELAALKSVQPAVGGNPNGPVDDEREAFEEFCTDFHRGSSLDGEIHSDPSYPALNGEWIYDDWNVQSAWATWQARAALSAPASVPDEVRSLRNLCAELYQVLGALDAPANVLDAASAAANGQPVPPGSLLPFSGDQYEELRKDKARLDSGCIITSERDEWGERHCVRRGLDLRASIDAAMTAREE